MYKRQVIFDDAGYSEYASANEKLFLSSVKAHSTVTIDGIDWSMEEGLAKSKIISLDDNGDSGYTIMGQHKRIKNTTTNRKILLNNSEIEIIDWFETKSDIDDKKIHRRFILSENYHAKINNNIIIISDISGKQILELYAKDYEFNNFEEGSYVGKNREIITQLRGFDIYSKLENLSKILIKIL